MPAPQTMQPLPPASPPAPTTPTRADRSYSYATGPIDIPKHTLRTSATHTPAAISLHPARPLSTAGVEQGPEQHRRSQRPHGLHAPHAHNPEASELASKLVLHDRARAN